MQYNAIQETIIWSYNVCQHYGVIILW
jgi:hypothetical protein